MSHFILGCKVLMFFHSHFCFPEPDLKIFYFGLSNSLRISLWSSFALGWLLCVHNLLWEWTEILYLCYVHIRYLLECGSSVGSLPNSHGTYCRMGGHAWNQKCLQRSQRKWGNSVVLLMAESWQSICFIYPICIKVDIAITTAGGS